MASESWVGFSRSPKPNKDLIRVTHQDQLATNRSLVEVFTMATSAAGLSNWLCKTSKSDVHTSGKIQFDVEGDFGLALFSAVDLGRLAVIQSEHFGEIKLEFKQSKNESTLAISFSKMLLQQERAAYIDFANSACLKLAERLGSTSE